LTAIGKKMFALDEEAARRRNRRRVGRGANRPVIQQRGAACQPPPA